MRVFIRWLLNPQTYIDEDGDKVIRIRGNIHLTIYKDVVITSIGKLQ